MFYDYLCSTLYFFFQKLYTKVCRLFLWVTVTLHFTINYEYIQSVQLIFGHALIPNERKPNTLCTSIHMYNDILIMQFRLFFLWFQTQVFLSNNTYDVLLLQIVSLVLTVLFSRLVTNFHWFYFFAIVLLLILCSW